MLLIQIWNINCQEEDNVKGQSLTFLIRCLQFRILLGITEVLSLCYL